MSVKDAGSGTGLANAAKKLGRTVDKGIASVDTLDFAMETANAHGWSVAESKFSGETRLSKAAQVSTMLTVVTLGLVIILGILVYSEVETALPAPSNTELNNASDNATSDFGDAMELAPVIMIVLIASLVLAVVQNFR